MFKSILITQGTPLGLLVLSIVLAACGPLATATQPPTVEPTSPPVAEPTSTSTPVAVSHGNEVGGYVDLVDALRAGGATIEPGGSIEQPFFSVSGSLIKVNGLDVQVFEYEDEAARETESSRISADGQPSPTTRVTWVDQPNFWAKGRVIALYIGTDADLIARLTEALGDPITQHAQTGRTYPDAVMAAINALSASTGTPADQISVESVEAVEWSDSCLGLGGPDEICLMVITPGYRIVLSVGGMKYEFHTNENGSAIRQK